MRSRKDALLRTLATVPPSARVLDLQTGAAADLARLGFDVWSAAPAPEADRVAVADVLGEEEATRRVTTARPEALGYPDEHFDWAAVSLASGADGSEVLREVRRVLRPGAWVWVASDDLPPDALAVLAAETEFAIAEEPVTEGGGSRAIFRRVGEHVGA